MLVSTGLPCWGILGKSSAVWWIWETAHFRNLALRARRLGDAVVGLAPCAARAPGCAAANGPIRRRNTTLGSLVDDLTRTERTRWIGLRVLCLSVCDGEVVLGVVGPFVTMLRPNMTMMMGRFQGYIDMDSTRDDNKKTSSKVVSILSVVDGRIGRTKGWMDGWMDGPQAQVVYLTECPSFHPPFHPPFHEASEDKQGIPALAMDGRTCKAKSRPRLLPEFHGFRNQAMAQQGH
jgi:hypothetical protein